MSVASNVAVCVRNVDYSYGKNQILKNFNATIPYGNIYALLGPSGGGKTTLLKLILGRLQLQHGMISVFGCDRKQMQRHLHQQHRSNISFMPQEIGLCDNLTINQTLKYFKLIYRISNEDFYIRRRELTTLTNLPNGHKLVGELSGGTKRRLSITVSLINNPDLVILDEPTVGIDALLRNKIWNYFVHKTLNDGMTMIIVTHYIEEAVNANRIGLMRNGRLLAEDDPKHLMAMYNEKNLENVFLKLCYYEDHQKRNNLANGGEGKDLNDTHCDHHHGHCDHHPDHCDHHHRDGRNELFIITTTTRTPSKDPHKQLNDNISSSTSTWTSSTTSSMVMSFQRLFDFKLLQMQLWILWTLIYRNMNKFLRSYFSLIIILLPATQALIFCLAVSKDVTLLPAAVYNEELQYLQQQQRQAEQSHQSFDDGGGGGVSLNDSYGKLFIDTLKSVRGHSIAPKYYNTLEDATNALRKHEAIGAIWIPENYSEAIDVRIENGLDADNSTIEESTIKIFLDNSYYILSTEFYQTLLQSFMDFSKKLFTDKVNGNGHNNPDQNLLLMDLPIRMEKTRLSEDYRFKDYFMPGYFLLFLYISQITISSLTLNKERRDGLFERSLIAGVTHELVFVSHLVTSLIISIIQLLCLDLIAFTLFTTNPNNSNYLLKFSLLLLESLNAMSLGFVISSSIDSKISCLVIVWFITIPQCLSSGVVWPLESLQQPFNYLFYLWPLSIPVKTIRHIMLQGWDLQNIHVQYGFISIGIPMILFFYIALIIFKRKQ